MVLYLQVRQLNSWNFDLSNVRVVLALLMSVGVVTHVHLKLNTDKVKDPKWLIYLTNQVVIHYKSSVKTFPGNSLVDYPLHPTCLAGSLDKEQVLVGKLLHLKRIFQAFKIG